MNNTNRARADAVAIWQAGVDAVCGDKLVRQRLKIDDRVLICDHLKIDLDQIDRIFVVGAGKAGASMAAGIEQVFAESSFADKSLAGWINVPDDCICSLNHIHLHAARPAGRNEPTEAGVVGSRKILEIVRNATENDLVICLLSGGGSALMPLPIDGITWHDKRTVTQMLSDAGANICELNTVRKLLSAIKGGGLARACQRAQMLALILSDVIGDPLDVIASGPTVPSTSMADDAIAILNKFDLDRRATPRSVYDCLDRKRVENCQSEMEHFEKVTNIVLGNNATAVDAARDFAASLGYNVQVLPTRPYEGAAEDVAQRLLEFAENQLPGTCILSGGEPTVKLVATQKRGKGGRNQQLVLAALVQVLDADPRSPRQERTGSGKFSSAAGFTLLSGGTDGEDGPTDAAGAILDEAVVQRTRDGDFDPREFLTNNDAYTFFARYGGLLITGPTHTNVCDLRVLLVGSR